jgi:hypothetical protein
VWGVGVEVAVGRAGGSTVRWAAVGKIYFEVLAWVDRTMRERAGGGGDVPWYRWGRHIRLLIELYRYVVYEYCFKLNLT